MAKRRHQLISERHVESEGLRWIRRSHFGDLHFSEHVQLSAFKDRAYWNCL